MITYEQNLDSGEQRIMFWCQGCKNIHCVRTKPPTAHPTWEVWGYDGNAEKPTFSPSVLTNGSEPERRCHIFVKAGMIEYLGDCFHDLKNTTVPLMPLPFGKEYFEH